MRCSACQADNPDGKRFCGGLRYGTGESVPALRVSGSMELAEQLDAKPQGLTGGCPARINGRAEILRRSGDNG